MTITDKKTLAQLREESGLKQDEVAKKLGITAAAYCRKEKGKRPLYAHELRVLAGMFGVAEDAIDFFTPKLTESVSPSRADAETA